MRTSSSRAQIMKLLEIDSSAPANHSTTDNPTKRKLLGRLHRYRYNVERLPFASNVQGPNGTAYEVSAQYLEAMNQILFLLQTDFNMTAGGKCVTPTNPIYSELKCHLNGMPGAQSKSQIAIEGCDNTTSLPVEITDALKELCEAPPGNDTDIYIVGGITGGLLVGVILLITYLMYQSRKFYRAEWQDRLQEEKRRLGLLTVPPAQEGSEAEEDEEKERSSEDDDYADHERKKDYHRDGHHYALVPTEEPRPIAPAASSALGFKT